MFLDVIKKLRESKLFLKEDVVQYQLLFWSCRPSAKERFDYFVAWDPEALEKTEYNDEPLIHAVINNWSIESFVMVINAGMKHYPEHLGFLFRKNSDGKTACELAFEKYGKDETFEVIQECIPADKDKYPILHHAIKRAVFILRIAVSAEIPDLSTIYCLLRCNPSLVERRIEDLI